MFWTSCKFIDIGFVSVNIWLISSQTKANFVDFEISVTSNNFHFSAIPLLRLVFFGKIFQWPKKWGSRFGSWSVFNMGVKLTNRWFFFVFWSCRRVHFWDLFWAFNKSTRYHLFQPLVMHLAAVNQRMSLDETLAAATINSAHSIGRSKTHGSIEKGKVADFVVIDAPRLVNFDQESSYPEAFLRHVIKKIALDKG